MPGTILTGSAAWAVVMHLASVPACTVPGMVPEFWPSVVRQESSYNPLALHDDDTGRAYYPDTIDASEVTAVRLMSRGHSVGVGLSQLTARSEREFQNKFGLTIREALDPCINMHAGARHFVDRALRIYNCGHPDCGTTYVAKINQKSTRLDSLHDPPPAGPTVVPRRRESEVVMHDGVHLHLQTYPNRITINDEDPSSHPETDTDLGPTAGVIAAR